MTPRQIDLVRSTWARVQTIQDRAAELFYARLFELDPALRSLFRNDLSAQGRKLMTMLNAAVRGLDHLDALAPAVKDLGRRHVAYGVTAEHYGTVALALLWTLEQQLGDGFTPEVRYAWTEAYTVLATTMQRV